MKGLFCGECFTIRTLPRTDGSPVHCDCGNVTGWWLDGRRGIARFAAARKEHVFFVGFHNHFLTGAVDGLTGTDHSFRELHEAVTDSPNHHFDKSRKGCWAIILKPGLSSDTAWATPEEYAEVLAKQE